MSSRSGPILLLLLPVFLAACGDDPASPPSDGAPRFAHVMGGPSQDVTSDAVFASDGLRIVTGWYEGPFEVSEVEGSLSSINPDIFVVAFRPDGSRAWWRRVGGNGYDRSFAIARDASDNLYLAGHYVFETSIDGTNLTFHGGRDVLVVKLDAVGNSVWAVGGGSADLDYASDVTVSPDGGVFACGLAQGEFELGGSIVGRPGQADGFLMKFNSSGAAQFGVTAAGTGFSECTSVASAADGSVYVCGTFGGDELVIGGDTLSLDPGSAPDGFVAHYDNMGSGLGAIRIGGAGDASVYGITVTSDGPVVVCTVTGDVDFDTNASGGEYTSEGDFDAFVASYDSQGQFRWAWQLRGDSVEWGTGICSIGPSDVVACGTFGGKVELGWHPPTAGGVFQVRLNRSGGVVSATVIETRGSFVNVGSDGEDATMLVGSMNPPMVFPNGTKSDGYGVMDGFVYGQ